MRASSKVATLEGSGGGRRGGKRKMSPSGDKGDTGDTGRGDEIKQIGHVQREHRLTINCELSKKQRGSAQDAGQATSRTKRRTRRGRRRKQQPEEQGNAEQSLAEFKHDLCVSL